MNEKAAEALCSCSSVHLIQSRFSEGLPLGFHLRVTRSVSVWLLWMNLQEEKAWHWRRDSSPGPNALG